MSSLTVNMITADLNQFKQSQSQQMSQSQYNSGHYATVTHYRRVYPQHPPLHHQQQKPVSHAQRIQLPVQSR